MKNKGLWILVAITAVAVAAATFDFQWEKIKDEKKTSASMVFQTKPENVHEITIVFANPSNMVRDGNPIVTNKAIFAFADGKWALKSPIDEIGDQESIRTFVEQLVGEKAQEVGGQKEQIDWAGFGLDSPKGSISVKDTTGKITEVSISNRKNFQGEAYLRRGQENKVLLGTAAWFGKIEKTLFDFRDKRPVRSSEDLSQITIQNSKGKFEFNLKDSKWSFAGKPNWKMDQAKVREVLGKLTGSTLTGFLSEGKLRPQDLKPFQNTKTIADIGVVLKDKKWTAKVIPGQEHTSHLLISEPSSVATMSESDAEKFFQLNPDQLRDKGAPFEFKKADVQKIEVKSAKGSVQAEKTAEDWKIVSKSDPKFDVDDKKISALVDRIGTLEAMEFQAKSSDKAGDKKILMKDSGGQTILELALSEPEKRKINGADQAIVAARSNLVDEGLVLDNNKVRDLGLDEMLAPKKEEKPELGQKPVVPAVKDGGH